MTDGRAPSGQALVSDEARSGLHPSGFDPSRTNALTEIEHRLDLIREYGGFSVWAWANEISEILKAIATEARRAETLGSVHESAVGIAETPKGHTHDQ